MKDSNITVLKGPLTVYQEPKATDPDLEDKNSSGEEYAPPTYSDNGESEVEDQESDLDGEVEGAEPKKSRKGKKPKPARADIKAKRHFAPASLPSTAHIEAKRKAHNRYVALLTQYNPPFFLTKPKQ